MSRQRPKLSSMAARKRNQQRKTRQRAQQHQPTYRPSFNPAMPDLTGLSQTCRNVVMLGQGYTHADCNERFCRCRCHLAMQCNVRT